MATKTVQSSTEELNNVELDNIKFVRDRLLAIKREGMEELVEDIRSMMQELPQSVQQDAQKLVQKLEQQM